MGKKMGRPTDSPKNAIVKIRADEQTVEMLNKCSEKLNLNRSDVIRKGIEIVYGNLDKE